MATRGGNTYIVQLPPSWSDKITACVNIVWKFALPLNKLYTQLCGFCRFVLAAVIMKTTMLLHHIFPAHGIPFDFIVFSYRVNRTILCEDGFLFESGCSQGFLPHRLIEFFGHHCCLWLWLCSSLKLLCQFNNSTVSKETKWNCFEVKILMEEIPVMKRILLPRTWLKVHPSAQWITITSVVQKKSPCEESVATETLWLFNTSNFKCVYITI